MSGPIDAVLRLLHGHHEADDRLARECEADEQAACDFNRHQGEKSRAAVKRSNMKAMQSGRADR